MKLNKIHIFSLAVIVALCTVFILFVYRNQVRNQLRLIFPHDSFFSKNLSYYSPAKDGNGVPYGTTSLSYGFVPETQILVGKALPSPVLILNDVAFNYMLVDKNGKNILSKNALNLGKSASIDGDYIYIPADNEIRILDRKTLKQVDEIKLDFIATFANVKSGILITSAGEESGHIKIFDIKNRKDIKEIYIDPTASSYPRGADIMGDILTVADTYNHRVYGINIKTNKRIFEFPAYYPNSVHFIGNETILVSEEHVNRITEYNINSKKYKVVLGCPLVFFAPNFYNDKTAPPLEERLIPNVKNTILSLPKSLCSENYQGIKTLYSPNGARKAFGGYLIADTDNHRVLFIKNGEIESIIYGLNNPVDAIFLE